MSARADRRTEAHARQVLADIDRYLAADGGIKRTGAIRRRLRLAFHLAAAAVRGRTVEIEVGHLEEDQLVTRRFVGVPER